MQITKDSTGEQFINIVRQNPCYGGLDLAAVSDLTAFVLAWPVKDELWVYPWFFIPEDGLRDRCKRDGVPYDIWSEQGYVELTPGSVTDWRYVCERIKQLKSHLNIVDIGFDAHGARDTVADLIEAGFTVSDVSQAMVSMSAPSKRFEELVLAKKLKHTGHPVLRWNVDSTVIYSDANNNIKPLKPHIGKSTKRIDGVIATIMAISRWQKATPVTPAKSIYSTRGLLFL